MRFNIKNDVMKVIRSAVDRRPWQQNFTAHTEDANPSSDYNLAQNSDGPVKLWNRSVWTDEHKIISVMIRQKCRENWIGDDPTSLHNICEAVACCDLSTRRGDIEKTFVIMNAFC